MLESMSDYRLAAFGSIVCVTLTAIGPAWAAAAPKDACALLTAKTVSSALGVEVDPGRLPVADDPHICNWREHGKADGPARHAMVTVMDAEQFENGRKKSRIPKTPQSGIGDEAYFAKPKRLPYTLSVRAGALYFKVMARTSVAAMGPENVAADSADDKDKAADEALARAIIGNH